MAVISERFNFGGREGPKKTETFHRDVLFAYASESVSFRKLFRNVLQFELVFRVLFKHVVFTGAS